MLFIIIINDLHFDLRRKFHNQCSKTNSEREETLTFSDCSKFERKYQLISLFKGCEIFPVSPKI